MNKPRLRRHVLAFFLLASAAALVLALVFWPDGPAALVNEISFEQIADGMSRKKVETILGCPPGDYAEPPMQVGHAGPENTCIWATNRHIIIVFFDEDGRVYHKVHWEMSVSWSDAIKRWLRIKRAD